MALAVGSPEPIPTNPSLIGTPPPIEPPKELDSARFAAQARKEAEFVRKQQAFKTEVEDYNKRKAQVDEILKKRDQFEDTRKVNPIEALKLIGFSEQEIFNYLAVQDKKELTVEEKAQQVASQTIDEKIKAFEKAQEDKEKKAIHERDQVLLGDFKASLGGLVESNPEKYEYCKHYGPQAVDLAYRTVLQIVEDSKGEDIPTTEEAMDLIEELYEEEDKRLMGLKKRQPKEAATQTEEPKAATERTRTVTTPAGHTPPAPAIQKTRALSNAARPTTASLERKGSETKDQKRERLMEALKRGSL